MKIEVIKKLEYKECPIYIRKIDKLFEYLIIYKKDLYSQYFNIRPKWYRRHHSKEQLQNIVKLVLIASHKTIDELKKQ